MATLRLFSSCRLGLYLEGRVQRCRFVSSEAPKAPKEAAKAPASTPPAAAAAAPNVTSAYYPDAPKTGDSSQYHAGEYYGYNEYSYYDLDKDMEALRNIAPDNTQTYTSFKAPVSAAK